MEIQAFKVFIVIPFAVLVMALIASILSIYYQKSLAKSYIPKEGDVLVDNHLKRIVKVLEVEIEYYSQGYTGSLYLEPIYLNKEAYRYFFSSDGAKQYPNLDVTKRFSKASIAARILYGNS